MFVNIKFVVLVFFDWMLIRVFEVYGVLICGGSELGILEFFCVWLGGKFIVVVMGGRLLY